MMKAAVAIAPTRPARADKAPQEGVGGGAPPGGQAARPRLPNIWPRPRGGLRELGGWGQGCPAPPAVRSSACAMQNRVGEMWAWLSKGPASRRARV